MSELANERMRVPDEALWPAVCPACGYSLRGLSEPRCPECGERVGEGEVVIVGVPAVDRGGMTDGRSWTKEMAWMAGAFLVAGAVMSWRDSSALPSALFCGAGFCLASVAITIRWWFFRRHGFPPGVVRVRVSGYVFGAGDTLGRRREWPGRLRVDMKRHRDELWRIRAYQMWGPVAVRRVFDIYAGLTGEQAEGVAERLRAWGRDGTVVRVRL